MKSFLICLLCIFVCFTTFAVAQQQIERYSSNPLLKLQVLGIALSEDLSTANTVLKDIFKEKMKVEILFPLVVDPTYKKLKERSIFDIAIGGKSVSGKKFFTRADSILELNANPFSVLVVDRKGTIRAINQAIMIDSRLFGRLVEEILLNLDGKEAITIEKSSPWETDLAREREESKPKALITLGSSESRYYSLLGKQIPVVPLKTLDGKDFALADSLKGKVSLLFIFVASSERDALMNATGTVVMVQLINEFYKGFTLGQAKPGGEFVKNAVADSVGSK